MEHFEPGGRGILSPLEATYKLGNSVASADDAELCWACGHCDTLLRSFCRRVTQYTRTGSWDISFLIAPDVHQQCPTANMTTDIYFTAVIA